MQEEPARGDVTDLLIAWREGDREAPARLFALVYDQLKLLARNRLRARAPNPSLGATGLVHEAYLKLADQTRVELRDRGHFFALAARAMRQVLVDGARRRATQKRGVFARPEELDGEALVVEARATELLALDQALVGLAGLDQRLSQVVELRFFGGLSVDEAAEALGTSARTVKRDWEKARALLQRELSAVSTA